MKGNAVPRMVAFLPKYSMKVPPNKPPIRAPRGSKLPIHEASGPSGRMTSVEFFSAVMVGIAVEVYPDPNPMIIEPRDTAMAASTCQIIKVYTC